MSNDSSTTFSNFPATVQSRSSPSTRRGELTRSLFVDHASASSACERQRVADQIVEINMGVSRSIARRYRNRGECVEDLEQVAHIGLLKAVAGFDDSRDRDFLAYAVPTITGEVKRHFRDRCWVVRPPRRIQELKSNIAGCTEMLCQTLGHLPDAFEIAHYLDESVADVTEALRADSCFTPASLDKTVGHSGPSTRGDLIGTDDTEFDAIEIRAILRPALDRLSAQDRLIVARRFIDQWTQDQIAQDLGLSQMQISRRLSRILLDLRQLLGEAQAN